MSSPDSFSEVSTTPYHFIPLILAVVHFLYYVLKSAIRARFPPGPPRIPLLEFLKHYWNAQEPIDRNLSPLAINQAKLSKWAQKYGKMFTIKFPFKVVVVVSDENLVTELFKKIERNKEMLTKLSVLRKMLIGSDSISKEESKVMKQSQFNIRSLREFGFGRQSYTEPIVAGEAKKLCGWIEKSINDKSDNNRIFLNHPIFHSVTNVMWTIITGQKNTGKQFQQSKIGSLVEKLADAWKNAFLKKIFFAFPWIKYVAPVRSGYLELKNVSLEIEEYMERQFREHRVTRTDGEPPRDLIDAFVDEIEDCKDINSTFYGDFGWKNSYISILGILLTAVNSIKDEMNWLLFYLSAHVDVQKKVQDEIDSVIGKNRNPAIADKKNMPYLESVILETLRLSASVPGFSASTLEEDISFYEYYFPEGTVVVPNPYNVNSDKAVWGDPENFRPERFMEGNENLKRTVKAFKTGQINCPAGRFAKDVVFLYAAELLQMYNFSVDLSSENVKQCLQPTLELRPKPKNVEFSVTARD